MRPSPRLLCMLCTIVFMVTANLAVAWTEPLLLAAWGERVPGERASADTLFNVASMAKPVSAEAVLRLASAGVFTLDEAMASAWIDPDLAADPRHRLLTPRLSLSHRSGLPNWRYETDGVLRFLREPGEPGYSGEGIEYVARFAAIRAGEDFEAIVQRLVLDPAGMAASTYTRRDGLEARIAHPVDDQGMPLAPQIVDRLVASDDLYTSVADYARFLVFVAGAEGLDPALAGERARVQGDRQPPVCSGEHCPLAAGFGLGWEVIEFADRRYLLHTGMDDGTFAIGFVDPDSGDGSLILSSSRNGWRLVLPVLEAIGADAPLLGWLRRQVE